MWLKNKASSYLYGLTPQEKKKEMADAHAKRPQFIKAKVKRKKGLLEKNEKALKLKQTKK